MTGILIGNTYGLSVVSTTINLASVAAATSAEQTFTIPGLQVGDFVVVEPPSTLNNGLGIVGARVSATDTLALRVMNATAGALDAASATFRVMVLRPDAGSVTTGVTF